MGKLEDLIKERGEKILVEFSGGCGNIPVITVRGKSLAEAWENSMLALYYYGREVRTEYDQCERGGNFIDPPSKDCTMRMIVEEPASEPFIHKAFPGGLEDLEEYRQEVLEGVKDHWVRDSSNPQDKRWEYTYHERLFNYRLPQAGAGIDQISKIIEGLAKKPFSRRYQAITWKAWEDLGIEDPPCLQSLWFRILPDEEEKKCLNMNVRFRSRDAYDAAFMNCFALVLFQEMVAREISKRIGEEVRLGRCVDESDSYHIYGKRLEDFESRFLRQVFSRNFEERTWTRDFAEEFFKEARPRIAEKIARQDEKYRK